MDFEPEILTPLYPSPTQLTQLLASHAGLSPQQKSGLVAHSLTRACVFGDISLLSFLLADPNGSQYLNLSFRDEDGLGLISITISGFGVESERDVEREECVRLLVNEGADVNDGDNAGWTALHHAALLAPPTLVSYLLTHGANVLAETRRRLTALDIIRAHSPIPGREDVALLLEEAMREKGWQGSRLDERRHTHEQRAKREEAFRVLRDEITKVLDLQDHWWGKEEPNDIASSDDSDDTDDEDLPPVDGWSSMLVYSPHSLPHILQSLVTDFPHSLHNAEPAEGLYLLCRFACLWGDPDWLEDLIAGSVDRIEETVYTYPEDLPRLTFWLHNCTMLLHLLRCDLDIAETVDALGLFGLVEELINAILVFVIRSAERHIDPFIETSLLDYVPASAEPNGVQFESGWSLLRSFQGRRKASAQSKPTAQSLNAAMRELPSSQSNLQSIRQSGSPLKRAASPTPFTPSTPSHLAAVKPTIASSPSPTPTQQQFMFPNNRPSQYSSLRDLTTFLSAFHALLTLSRINPIIIAQAFSQIMYWTSCELFNRILTRKKYLCRSRASHINNNIAMLEAWGEAVDLPIGITSHFSPVRELLFWLQSLSSLQDFANLVAIIQSFRNLNPFQMRRAVKDYRYEVGEARMSEECAQYLAQLQKDWERHRVKLGVENMRKELNEREKDDSGSELLDESHITSGHNTTGSSSSSASDTESIIQRSVDRLFDAEYDMSEWLPSKPPPVLGELLESRHMLPLILPSDPKFLCAIPHEQALITANPRAIHRSPASDDLSSRSPALHPMRYKLEPCNLHSATSKILTLIDGSQWTHRKARSDMEEESSRLSIKELAEDDEQSILNGVQATTHLTEPVARRPVKVND